VNPFDSKARVFPFTNAWRPALRNRCSSTQAAACNKYNYPDANNHDPDDNRTFSVLDCTKFQHALAFRMRRAAVAGVASCFMPRP